MAWALGLLLVLVLVLIFRDLDQQIDDIDWNGPIDDADDDRIEAQQW